MDAIGRGVNRRSWKAERHVRDDAGLQRGIPIRKLHLRARQLLQIATQGHQRQPLDKLTDVLRVHHDRATHLPGQSRQGLQIPPAALTRQRHQSLRDHRRATAHARVIILRVRKRFDHPEALAQAQHQPVDPPIRDQGVGAAADDGHRHAPVGGGPQQRDQVLRGGGLGKPLGRAANAEAGMVSKRFRSPDASG